MASFACFAFAGCSRASGRVPWADCLRILLDATPATCPLALGAWSLAESGPYFALGRVRASFAPGLDPSAGRPLLRGAATLNGSSVPPGHGLVVPLLGHEARLTRLGTRPCQRPPLLRWARDLRLPALTLRWAGSAPLLRRGWTLLRVGPYYAGPPRSTARLSHLGTGSSSHSWGTRLV